MCINENIRKKATFIIVTNKPIIHRATVLTNRLLPQHVSVHVTQMRLSNNMTMYIFLKRSVAVHENSGSPFFRVTTEKIIRARHNWGIKVGYDLINQLRNNMSIMSFQISSRRESRETPESLRWQFSEISRNNSAISDAQDNISKTLNRRGKANLPYVENIISNS